MIVNRRFRTLHHIHPDNLRAKYRAEMMRDESVATTDIQDVSAAGNNPCNLQGHVVSASNRSAATLTKPAPFHSVNDILYSIKKLRDSVAHRG